MSTAVPVYRVALVSGANCGLGFEVARQLGECGMTVLLGARDPCLPGPLTGGFYRDGRRIAW